MARVGAPRALAEGDDRETFDCGRDSLNGWFRRHAWQNQAANISRTTVVCDNGTGRIVGFVALSAAQIERAFLAKPQQRNRPDPIPVTLLGQLAVDIGHQSRGHARSLLTFALVTAWRASQTVGSFGVIAHPLDESARAFYTRWGFEDLPLDPRRAMIIRMSEIDRSGLARL